jgi:hypothetical protein
MSVALIRIRRDRTLQADIFRSYKILLDGGVLGAVKRGQSLDYEIGPGRHKVQLKIDWARSPAIEVDVAAGEEAVIRCWPRANPLRAVYWMTLGRKRWIGIELVG